jgi:hypothetical protein
LADTNRIKDEKTKNQHDKAFYFAVDEKGGKGSATEAVKIKQRNPNAKFYCPACYRRNHKTEGIPKDYSFPQRSRFDRYSPDAHLSDCPYKNPRHFLNTMAQKLDIVIEDNRTLCLKMMPYDGGSMLYRPFVERWNTYWNDDHIKFMKLIKYLLQDYDDVYFHQSYNGIKLPFGKKSKKLKDLFFKIDAIKSTKQPFAEKLNLLVGKVKEVRKSYPYLIVTFHQHHSEFFPFSLQLHSHFYKETLVNQLIDKEIACLGYLRKYQDQYKMEILSVQH